MRKQYHQENAMWKKWKSTLFGYAGVLGILALLYATGWHGGVRAKLQQGLLWTGLIQADIQLSEEERVSVNYNMPLLTFDGKQTNLSAYKGNVIFLNFWASWCAPCRAEMPNIQSLYERYEEREDLQFMMVSIDENPEKARRYLAEEGYTFDSYLLDGTRPEQLQSVQIPATFVINREGVIVSKKIGVANYDTRRFRNFLDQLLQEQADRNLSRLQDR